MLRLNIVLPKESRVILFDVNMTLCLALCREFFLDFQNLVDACGEIPKFLITTLIFLIKLRGQLD